MAKKTLGQTEKTINEDEILQEAENELFEAVEPEVEPEVVLKSTVLFKFNKNVRLGNVSIKKDDSVEINREDALLFETAKHGEIIEIG